MPKALLFFVIVCFSLFCISCSQAVYEIQIEPEVFSLLQSKNFFEQYETVQSGNEASCIASVLYEDKKIKLIASKKESSFTYCKLAEITTAETAAPPLSVEIERKYIYPCIPFCEDLSVNEDENPVQQFYFDEIPAGYIALPIEIDGNKIYADNNEYTLFSSTFTECVFEDLDTIKSKKLKKSLPIATQKAESWFRESFAPVVKWDSKPEVLFVCAAGDMMLGRGVDSELIETGTPESVFTNTLPILQGSDLTIGNLEGTITERTDNAQKTYTFKFKKEVLSRKSLETASDSQ